MPEHGVYPEIVPGGDGWCVSESLPGPTREKSYRFALTIIDLFKRLEGKREYVISKQLLKSGTSIGANVVEASAAESRRDFIHKMAIASKEARETKYWLQLLSDSDLAEGIDVAEEMKQAEELIRLLTSIVKQPLARKMGSDHVSSWSSGARSNHQCERTGTQNSKLKPQNSRQ